MNITSDHIKLVDISTKILFIHIHHQHGEGASLQLCRGAQLTKEQEGTTPSIGVLIHKTLTQTQHIYIYNNYTMKYLAVI